MALKPKIDQVDKNILEILQKNGRITNAQLSKEVGLSPAPTLERVKKLELNGFIKSYHAVLAADQLGLGVSTFVRVSLKSHNKATIEKFVSAIEDVEEIIECHHTTGSCDFMLKIVACDISAYQQLMLEKITNIDDIDDIESMIILSTFKNSRALPVHI
jgi:DNA-binding Lrp family transcriptional regulator